MKVYTLALATALAVSGCATTQAPTIRPASYLAATLGSNMDATDHRRANEVLETGSENRPAGWVNPTNGRRFIVTPTKTLKKGSLDCREFTATYGGRTIEGTACRQSDGSWLPS